jgi:hypothetical protein
MIIRQDFQELPPKMFMMQILENCAKIYVFLWDRKDVSNKVLMTWNDISKFYQKNNFRSSLRKLNDKGLISYDENDQGFSVELVGWDEIIDE